MRGQTFDRFSQAVTVLPCLWVFAAAAALDRVIDIQTLFLPAMAGAALVSAFCTVSRRAER
jgi:hypothetical protein